MAQPREEVIPTRTTLIRRLKDWQDDVSWRDFYKTYRNLIQGVALRSGLTDTEIQDVVQETMIAVARHMPDFTYDRSHGSFKAWLLNMTRWRIADELRKRSAASAVLCEDISDPAILEQVAVQTDADWNALWNDEWERALLDSAVENVKRQLDPQKYQIFDFHMNKQWPPDKIAKMFGVTVEQVYLIKHRVAEAIRQEVEQLKLKMA